MVKPTKKILFFIVEGSTDKTALEKIFKKIYRKKHVRFVFTNGDITSDDEITKDNVCDILYAKVKKYLDENKLKKQMYGRSYKYSIQMGLISLKQRFFPDPQMNFAILQPVFHAGTRKK